MERQKPTVAVDLDGVLAYHYEWNGVEHFGDVIEGAHEFLRTLRQYFKVIIYSCRGNAELNGLDPSALYLNMAGWLHENGLEHDAIFVGQGKPSARAYIDDRGVSCRPQSNSAIPEYTNAIKDALYLTHKYADIEHMTSGKK